MIKTIRKIGNSKGIIIPEYILQEIGSPVAVNITLTEDGILLNPVFEKPVSRKPRNMDETNGFYNLMKSKIEDNIDKGKTTWVSKKIMERKL
ncbi:MAG: hypothetical protein FIB07_06535 [Candidatus Methanoperedens sp.]|nr:hypothetical protein [Candidatus Methanoperedens sp.]